MKRGHDEVESDPDYDPDSDSEFIVSDEDDYRPTVIPKKSRRLKYDSTAHQISSKGEKSRDKILRMIDEDDITDTRVYESQLSDLDKIWMIERLDVLSRMDMGTMEYLDLKHKLRQRFKELQEQNAADVKMEKRLIDLRSNSFNLKLKILRSQFSVPVKSVIYQKYNKMTQLSPDTEEYHKVKEWIHNVLAIPHQLVSLLPSNKPKDMMKLINNINNTLNKNIYGMTDVKERLLGIMLSNFTQSEAGTGHNCIAMVGPSGIGKTLFGMSIAEALGLPFSKISLAGMNDPTVLKGHPSTYIGSNPGMIAQAIQRMGCLNGVIYLDEIDKCSDKIRETLLEILDHSQNYHYHDNYMPEVPIDLSNISFIISANSLERMPTWIVQRMPVIKLDDFTPSDKQTIVQKFIIPKVSANLGIKPKLFKFQPAAVKHLITRFKHDTGVRTIETAVEVMFQKLNMLIHQHQTGDRRVDLSYRLSSFSLPIRITKQVVDTLLS